MEEMAKGTVDAILEAGKQEFLTYGYEKASLRRIAANAQVTTGAIYGYFSGKEELFETLLGDGPRRLLEIYGQMHQDFKDLPAQEKKEGLTTTTEEEVPKLIHFVYDHFDEFKLLLCSGKPGMAEEYFAKLAAIEEKSCWDFLDAMREMGKEPPQLDDIFVHILCRSFFQQIQEYITHDVPRERAVECSVVMNRFQHAGWIRITGI